MHVSTLGRTRVRRPGVIGHNHTFADGELLDGVPISGPVSTFVECARTVSLPDLVAIGDHLVHRPRFPGPFPRPFVDVEELRAALADRRGPGVQIARAASLLVRPGAESAPESHLRLTLVLGGVPEPELGIEVADVDGRSIGYFDLGWRRQRVLAEYDGDQHRTSREQYDKDIRRYDRATAAGWTVIRVRSAGLYREPEKTVDRVRRALAGLDRGRPAR